MASNPRKDEVDRLKELKKIIAGEEKETKRLTEGSKKLKEKVIAACFFFFFSNSSVAACLVLHIIQAVELQTKIENAGGERLRSQKAKVDRIQSVSG